MYCSQNCIPVFHHACLGDASLLTLNLENKALIPSFGLACSLPYLQIEHLRVSCIIDYAMGACGSFPAWYRVHRRLHCVVDIFSHHETASWLSVLSSSLMQPDLRQGSIDTTILMPVVTAAQNLCGSGSDAVFWGQAFVPALLWALRQSCLPWVRFNINNHAKLRIFVCAPQKDTSVFQRQAYA